MAMLELPQEILANVLSHLSPQAIVYFGLTCRAAYESISPLNQLLWRSAFLHVFDDPNDAWSMMPGRVPSTGEREWDWHHELTSRFRAMQAVRSRRCGSDSQAEACIEAILSILDTAKFDLNTRDLAEGKLRKEDDRYTSKNLQILSDIDSPRQGVESLIHDVAVYQFLNSARANDSRWNSLQRPITRSMTLSESEKHRPESASRLHVLYGLTLREKIEHKARGTARRKVYDWSLSGPDNDYAPFLRDGSGKVDWSILEGVVSVICRNFALCAESTFSMPQGFCFSLPNRILRDQASPGDWAGLTGAWIGTYSFLDYADLFAFNTWDERERDGPRPTLDDEPEDCGDLMRLELNLDDTITSDPRLKTTLPVSPDLPVLYFSGVSQGYAGSYRRPAIGVRGTVSLVPGGREVRWRFVIAYGGQDQWQLEGVQPGGIRSGGIYGLWTQCNHEENGPLGPFCYFPQQLCKSKSLVLVV